MTARDFEAMTPAQIVDLLKRQVLAAEMVMANVSHDVICQPCHPNNTGQLLELGDFVISARFRELLYSHVDPVPDYKISDLMGGSLKVTPLHEVSALRQLCDRAVEIERLYMELLYAVARKFPGESRHQTALRYIRQAEVNLSGDTPQEAKP